MAQRTTVTLVDDLDGSDAHGSVEFGLDGIAYEIDLSDGNAASLRDALADYVAHARRQSGPRRRRATSRNGAARSSNTNGAGSDRAPVSAGAISTNNGTSTADREQNKAIRAWARQQGMTVSERGRIPSEISQAFQKAH